MIVKHYEEVKKEEVTMEGVKDVTIRWLIGKGSEAPNFYLRLFEIEPGGHSPFHSHQIEHEIFVLDGEGQINTAGGPKPLRQGTFALVMPKEEHQFENTGRIPFKFLCIIPK